MSSTFIRLQTFRIQKSSSTVHYQPHAKTEQILEMRKLQSTENSESF